jgi:hypothetical protein
MTQAHRDIFSPTDRPFGTLRQIAPSRAVAPSFALLLLISADYRLPASHAAARELTYPA